MKATNRAYPRVSVRQRISLCAIVSTDSSDGQGVDGNPLTQGLNLRGTTRFGDNNPGGPHLMQHFSLDDHDMYAWVPSF